MSMIAPLSFFASLTVGAAWVVFPSPVSFVATAAALLVMWLIEYGACAAAIRRNQAAGAVVNFVALRCIGYATTMTGIVAVCVVALRVFYAPFVEAP